MAYWLVFQGLAWKHEWPGEYLWAPKRDKGGKSLTHWLNMTKVKAGDVIFSGVKQAIRGVSVAKASAYDFEYPKDRSSNGWEPDGLRIDVCFQELANPMPYKSWAPDVLDQFPSIHSPFKADFTANQGYLYALPNSVGEFLMSKGASVDADIEQLVETALERTFPDETERQVFSKARIGQGQFRNDLLKRWGGKCPVTGVSHVKLLRASHIKPWCSSNNAERLDVENGLLLSSMYDAAFDAFLITFDRSGNIQLAKDFTPTEALKAGIDPFAKISGLTDANFPYLDEHARLVEARLGLIT